jgi:hypothetical protein
MERRAALLALALTLPLALYGIPYAYASATSDHVVRSTLTVTSLNSATVIVNCPSIDYAVSGGYTPAGFALSKDNVEELPDIIANYPTLGGVQTITGQTPDGWGFWGANGSGFDYTATVWVVCQTPLTVAGIGVPQFGSLYFAIVLGAVAYFLLSRRFARSPTSLQA